jgi:hypothetical protein
MSEGSGHKWVGAIGALLAGLAAILTLIIGFGRGQQASPPDAVLPTTPNPSVEASRHEPTRSGAFGHVSSPDAGPSIWDGSWHHVVGTYDGATLRLYVDGNEIGHGTPARVRIPYGFPTDKFYVGELGARYDRNRDKAVCEHAFSGDVDEVAVWTKALTPEEVSRRHSGVTAEEVIRMNSGQRPGDPSVLGGLWHLDGGHGDTVVDSSSNRNDGRRRGQTTKDQEGLAWIPGRYEGDNALHLSGTVSVEIEDSSTLEPQRLSVEAWVRASPSSGSYRYVMSKGAYSCDGASYALHTGSAGGLVFSVADVSGTISG